MKRNIEYYDSLTGLQTKELFFDSLTRILAYAKGNKKIVAVLFICVDRLKLINDKLGEIYGNKLLKDLAKRLARYVRKGDILARHGRNEFAILLHDIRNAEDAALVARKILTVIDTPFILKKRKWLVSVSVGI